MALYRLFNPFVLLSGADDEPPDDPGFGDGDDPIIGGFTGIGEDPINPGHGDSGNATNSFADWMALTGGTEFEEYKSWFMNLYGEDFATANAQWALLNPDKDILYPDI